MAKKEPGPTGFAVVDKEPGWTSHDVVAKARGVFGTRKVGHSGTLDPDATGVLILGVGKATRLMRFLDGAVKRYTAEIVFGATTSTLDSSGEVTATFDMSFTGADASREVSGLTGSIMQVPPMVSAKKVDGKRLHELAREGIEIEREPVPVTVYEFEIEPTSDPLVYRCSVACSAGTYIRSLAADLGTALGGGAHLRNLRRTAIGSFTDEVAQSLEHAVLRPPHEMLAELGVIMVSDSVDVDIRYGKVLERAALGIADADDRTAFPLVDKNGELLAVYEPHRGRTVKPAVVVADPPPRAPVEGD